MSCLLNLRCFALRAAVLNKNFLLINGRNLTAKAEEEEVKFVSFEDAEDPEEKAAKEALIEQKRNKSGLLPPDYNRQHDKVPYSEPQVPFHETLGYRRRLHGKYGHASNVNPSLLWPSKKELEAMKEFDAVLQPFKFHELVARVRERRELEEKKIKEEEAMILEKVKNVRSEILAFHKKVAQKKKEALALSEKKNKLIDEVRKRIGFDVSTEDKRFTDLMKQLQKEAKAKSRMSRKAFQEERDKAILKAQIEESKKDQTNVDSTESEENEK